MDANETQDAATELLGDFAAHVTETIWGRVLPASTYLDQAGRTPTDPNWEPSYCPFWAAAEALLSCVGPILAANSKTATRFTADGASFEFQQVAVSDLTALARHLRELSPISRLISPPGQFGTLTLSADRVGFEPASNVIGGWQ